MRKEVKDQLFAPPRLHDANLSDLHESLLEELRKEVEETPGFGTIELMMVERLANVYVAMRDKENAGLGAKEKVENGESRYIGFEHERNWKETIQLWMTMATKFQELKHRPIDPDVIKKHVVQIVEDKIFEVVDRLPKEVRPFVAEELASALESAKV
jgi:hypothetical protein